MRCSIRLVCIPLFITLFHIPPAAGEYANFLVPASESWRSQLKTGQVIVTESSDPMDFLVLMLYPQFSPYFHAGIIEVSESGDVFVFEANGDFSKMRVGDSPSDSISGWVKRVAFDDFLESSRTVSVFNSPASVSTDKLIEYSLQQAKLRTPFDPYFNTYDHSKLYCSEFVALAIEHAGGKQYRALPMRNNQSAQALLDWMKVPDRVLIPAYTLVDPRKWVGTVSLDYSPFSIMIDRAVKLELYQRFTADQKIGNMMQYGSFNVAFRENITQFYKQAVVASELLSPGQRAGAMIVSKVRQVANEAMGAAPGIERSVPICQISPRDCVAY